MARRETNPATFLPLTPAIAHILLAVADQDRHGYAIMQEIERLTDGAVSMGPGTLYGTIKRMIAAGLLHEAEDRPDAAHDDERRRYYGASPLGRRVLEAETARMASLVAAARAKRVRAR
ncbi:MAG TPA: PadR family transcriptional regulator [Vicinamibacterales bacterium]